MLRWALALTLSTIALSARAEESWHATATEKSTALGNRPVTLELYYRDGKLRIDHGPELSSLFDLRAGRLTVLNHKQKSYVTDTFEELAKLRDAMIANTKKQLASLPADAKKELSAQLAAIDRKVVNLPAPTGKKSAVGSWSCEEYRATSATSDTTFCVAKDVGAPVAEFLRHGKTLAERLHKLKMGGAEGPGGVMLFEAARSGFVVRSEAKATFSGQTFTTKTVLTAIRAEPLSADRFDVPKDYTVSRPPDLH